MRKLIYILAFLPLQLFATNYYVATNGNDSWNGLYATHQGGNNGPWATWGKAFTSTSVKVGDTVFIRGGVYNITVINGDGYGVTRAGTADKWIVYANYPGETPILDCSNGTTKTNYTSGIGGSTANNANHIKFKGLTVRNLYQKRKDTVAFASGFACENGFFEFENCCAYNIEGHGFDSYFYNGYPVVNGVHTFINCDAELGEYAVLTAFINSSSSYLGWNTFFANPSNAGNNPADEITIGLPGTYSDFKIKELIIRTVADSTTDRDKIIAYLMNEYKIS